MKHTITSLLLLLSSLIAYGQTTTATQQLSESEKRVIEKETKRLGDQLCDYIIKVGTTRGQRGAVSDREKNDIIYNRVPGLFYNYDERKMLTTYARGTRTRSQSMSSYFRNLKGQSLGGLNTARSYELHCSGFVVNKGLKGYRFVKNLPDGCELYEATIRITQYYHVIRQTNEGWVKETEKTIKDITTYAIKKPNGRTGVFLGDVTRAINE